MNLLALETSTERLSIAILRDGQLFARDVDAGQQHSELALPLLQELVSDAKLTLREMDAIAFGQGPGSFTGVRIACGLAQGMALGIAKPVVPVQTQMALAQQADADNVVVALDARMSEIYFAAYQRDATAAGGWRVAVEPMLVKPDALPALDGGGWLAIGSGFDVPALAGQLTARYGDQLAGVMHAALPRAQDVARIAAHQIERLGMQSAIAPEHAAPLYLRNNVAMTIDERRAHHAAKARAVS